jgi:hypothetical protein
MRPAASRPQEPGESELEALTRLAARGAELAAELLARRKALGRLRFVLNHQAAAKLDGLVREAAGKPRSPGKHAPGGKAAAAAEEGGGGAERGAAEAA